MMEWLFLLVQVVLWRLLGFFAVGTTGLCPCKQLHNKVITGFKFSFTDYTEVKEAQSLHSKLTKLTSAFFIFFWAEWKFYHWKYKKQIYYSLYSPKDIWADKNVFESPLNFSSSSFVVYIYKFVSLFPELWWALHTSFFFSCKHSFGTTTFAPNAVPKRLLTSVGAAQEGLCVYLLWADS